MLNNIVCTVFTVYINIHTYMQKNYLEGHMLLNLEMCLGCVLCGSGQGKGWSFDFLYL